MDTQKYFSEDEYLIAKGEKNKLWLFINVMVISISCLFIILETDVIINFVLDFELMSKKALKGLLMVVVSFFYLYSLYTYFVTDLVLTNKKLYIQQGSEVKRLDLSKVNGIYISWGRFPRLGMKTKDNKKYIFYFLKEENIEHIRREFLRIKAERKEEFQLEKDDITDIMKSIIIAFLLFILTVYLGI